MDVRDRSKPGPEALTSPEQKASAIYSFLLSNSERTKCKIANVIQSMADRVCDVTTVLNEFPDVFDLNEKEGFVDLKCPLDICNRHNSKQGCRKGSCEFLHICKFFIIGSCSRKDCKFGHSFNTQHNAHLLQETNLHVLDDEQLKRIIRNAKSIKEMMPPICSFHNSDQNCTKGEKCQFLHICEDYIKTDSCLFSNDVCPKGHDLMTPQAQKILQRYGRKVTDISLVLKELRLDYQEEAAKQANGRPSKKGRETQSSNDACAQAVPLVDVKLPRPQALRPQINNPHSDTHVPYPKLEQVDRETYPLQVPNYSPAPAAQSGQEASFRSPQGAYRGEYQTHQPPQVVYGRQNPPHRPPQAAYLGQNPSYRPPQAAYPGQTPFYRPPQAAYPGQTPSYRPPQAAYGKRGARAFQGGQNRERPFPPEVTNTAAPRSDNQRPRAPNPSHPKRPATKADKEKTEICTFHLQGRCRNGENCFKLHESLPCVWQYKKADNWVKFIQTANEKLEQEFCNPHKSEVVVKVANDPQIPEMKVDLEEMSYKGCGRGQVRRLSTESWGTAYINRPFITHWLWYWQDEHGSWQQYEDSMDMEEHFIKSPSDKYHFETGSNSYVLNFKEMVQKNDHYGTQRALRRRPRLYVKPTDADAPEKTSPGGEAINIPPTWNAGRQATNEDYELKLVQLQPGDSEYNEVAERFQETMEQPIKLITRIQNFDLWEEYASMKKRMLKKRGISMQMSPSEMCGELNEKLLFHGTKEKYIEAIYTNRGFDFRNAGLSVGTLLGKGNYFARDANYSKCYAESSRLFVVKVLVGEMTLGQSSYTKPPPLDPNKPLDRLYDSCVDDVQNPKIFVTFEFAQSYPAYLIDY